MEDRIPVIIPAYEPDRRLLELLDRLTDAGVSPIVIVDDGSGEEYRPIFDACGKDGRALVLRHEENRGKGRALKTAFAYCLDHMEGLAGCVTADSDGQHTPEAIVACRDVMRQRRDCLVLGVRDFSGENIPEKSRFGNELTRKVFRVLYRRDITDTQTGLRGIPADQMRELLSLPGERFEYEIRMLIDAVEKKREIVEVAIETVYDSKEDHSTHFRPVTDSARIYMVFRPAFGRFVVSSLSSSVVDLALFQIFCLALRGVDGGLGYVAAASVAARVVSAAYNYLVNYFFVFHSRKKHGRSLAGYAGLAAVQMCCSALLTMAGLRLTHAEPEVLVKIPVDVLLFFISYRIQKKYIY